MTDDELIKMQILELVVRNAESFKNESKTVDLAEFCQNMYDWVKEKTDGESRSTAE